MLVLDDVRPRIKRVFPAFPIEQTIYVQRCGEVVEIDDADGRAQLLLELLDGTRTLVEVQRELAETFPDSSLEDVRTTVQQLDQAGLIEDGAAAVPLDAYAQERWKRDLGFYEIYADLATSKYELQRRLRQCRVALLGLGGVGSHLLYDLMGMGVEDLRVVDFDTVELSNLNRQILYSEADIGRRKTEAATERVRGFNSRARIEARPLRLASPEDVRAVADGRDVVIAAVDQPKMQVANWVNEGCVAAGATLLTGGVDLQRSFFYTVIPGQTGCVECWRSGAEADPVSTAISAEMERIEARRPGERFGQDLAAFGPLVTAQTACLVNELVRVATGIAPPVAAGRMMELRFEDFTLREAERWERMPGCRVCGVDEQGVDEPFTQEGPAKVAQ
jgi:molybdopterin/thiamine biosynthesis adenylyltransferase